jgi:hypothetical protein
MSLNELTPKEVLTIYLMNKNKLDIYQELFETKMIVENLILSETTTLSSRYLLTEESIDQLKTSIHYMFIVDLDKKLEPIASVIIDVEKNLYNQIIESFKEII